MEKRTLIPGGRGSTITLRGGFLRCAEGRLWATWTAGPDLVLSAGDALRLPDGTSTVIQAIGRTDARIEIASAGGRLAADRA